MTREGEPKKIVTLSTAEYKKLLSGGLTDSNQLLMEWMNKNNIKFNDGTLTKTRNDIVIHSIRIVLDGKVVLMCTDWKDFGTIV